MTQHTDLNQTLEAWAETVLKEWADRIERLGIHRSGDLARSLEKYIYRAANGNPEIIAFSFKYYGKFVDMGIHRGVPLGSTKKKPKVWYSEVFSSSVKQLFYILSEHYAQRGALTIIETISDNVNAHSKRHHTV